MKVIPAIDIMEGKVVRLIRGDPEHTISYENLGDPLAVARRWESEGARTIHIIDLDSALGLSNNLEVIKKVVSTIEAHVQVGGGIRSLERARTLLERGVDRIILGTLAFKEPNTVKTLLDEFGKNRVIIALDHLNGTVMVHGWRTSTNRTVYDAMSKFSRLGVELFLVTSVLRDGTMTGPDLKTLHRLCHKGVGVIAAGGIRSFEDLVALKGIGVQGVVIGRALYEGAFSLRDALKIGEE